MSTVTVLQTRIDIETKKAAEEILNQMGMSVNDGIRIFLRQVINDSALPFKPNTHPIPNKMLQKRLNDQKDSYIKVDDFDAFLNNI